MFSGIVVSSFFSLFDVSGFALFFKGRREVDNEKTSVVYARKWFLQFLVSSF